MQLRGAETAGGGGRSPEKTPACRAGARQGGRAAAEGGAPPRPPPQQWTEAGCQVSAPDREAQGSGEAPLKGVVAESVPEPRTDGRFQKEEVGPQDGVFRAMQEGATSTRAPLGTNGSHFLGPVQGCREAEGRRAPSSEGT